MALGWFDGLHIGHSALIEKTVETARSHRLFAAVWTFEGSKKAGRDTAPGFILSDGEKSDLLRGLGADILYAADFYEMKDVSPEDFVSRIVIDRCRCDIALCGFNYRFGAGGSGNAETLVSLMRAHGKDAVVMPPVDIDGVTVSSTAIKRYLADGMPDAAAKLLGRPFSLTSAVGHGRRIGHRLGIPTLNQTFPEGAFVPKHGVYVSTVTVGERVFRAVSNVGVRPTFGEDGPVVCESNILSDDPGECYGRTVKTGFLYYIRPEKRFDSEERLKAQIKEDISFAMAYDPKDERF